jgi:hypothetical protein
VTLFTIGVISLEPQTAQKSRLRLKPTVSGVPLRKLLDETRIGCADSAKILAYRNALSSPGPDSLLLLDKVLQSELHRDREVCGPAYRRSLDCSLACAAERNRKVA